jgi:hypothetical protein
VQLLAGSPPTKGGPGSALGSVRGHTGAPKVFIPGYRLATVANRLLTRTIEAPVGPKPARRDRQPAVILSSALVVGSVASFLSAPSTASSSLPSADLLGVPGLGDAEGDAESAEVTAAQRRRMARAYLEFANVQVSSN